MPRDLLTALTTVLALCATGQALRMTMSYSAPILSFHLPNPSEGNVNHVTFHFTYKSVELTGEGVLTASNTWQYDIGGLDLTGFDHIPAYAAVFDVDGFRLITTDWRDFKLDEAVRLANRPAKGKVIFRDDFDTLSMDNWKYEVSMYGGYNWEFQVYTNDRKNIYTKDGKLYIRPTLTTDDPRFSSKNYLHTGKMSMKDLFGYCTNGDNFGCDRDGKYGILPPIMSGKLKSKKTFRYGTMEIRAKIPTGDWLWPAIWMMPHNNEYGGWPRSGEIDIMESRGNAGEVGYGSVSSTLHWGPTPDADKYGATRIERNTTSWTEDFHTWRLEWTPDHINTFIDDEELLHVTPETDFWKMGHFSGKNIWTKGGKMAPFDQDFYLILNVAVGTFNGYFPEKGYCHGGKPWKNGDAKAMQKFWEARNDWLPTWRGDDVAMIVDYVEYRSLD